MTKTRKKVVITDRQHKNAKSTVKSAERKLSQARRDEEIAELKAHNAILEAQLETIQEQIAALQGKGIGNRAASLAGIPAGIGERTEMETLSPLEKSPSPRMQLAKPVIRSVFAINPHTIVINWLPVEGAESYNVRVGTNEEVTPYLLNTTCSASAISLTLTGLDPDTQYWVAMRTHAVSPDTNSNYTYYGPVTTPSATQPGVVGDLSQWWHEMQIGFDSVSTLIPQLKTTVLTTTERMRLNGSGVRRYGFIDKVSDIAAAYPQFWPALVQGGDAELDFLTAMKERLREIEVLRNMIIWLRWLARVVGDLRLQAGDDAFRMANTYYMAVRTAARSKLPEAQQVFEMLKLFWKQRNRFPDEPTEQEAIRDFKGVLRGKKTGMVAAERTSDAVTKGKRAVVDETRSTRQHGGAKVAETEKME